MSATATEVERNLLAWWSWTAPAAHFRLTGRSLTSGTSLAWCSVWRRHTETADLPWVDGLCPEGRPRSTPRQGYGDGEEPGCPETSVAPSEIDTDFSTRRI